MRLSFRTRKPQKYFSPLSLISLKPVLRGVEFSPLLLMCLMGLLVFGWVMVYSSSALFAEARYEDQFFFLKRQIVWSFIGVGGFLIASNLSLTFWQKKCSTFLRNLNCPSP